MSDMNERRAAGKRDVWDGGGGSGEDGGADDDCITYGDERGVSLCRDRGLGTRSQCDLRRGSASEAITLL